MTICEKMSEGGAIAGRGKRRWKRVACYVPVAALVGEFVWIFLLFLALIFSVGDTPYVNTPDKSYFLSWLSAVPAGFGVVFGVIGIALRLPAKIVDWIFLLAGTAGCAVLFFLCTHGLW
jgi:hypothetical protein